MMDPTGFEVYRNLGVRRTNTVRLLLPPEVYPAIAHFLVATYSGRRPSTIAWRAPRTSER